MLWTAWRVPWVRYTLYLSLPLLSKEDMGSWLVISHTYIQLTMPSYENIKLTDALGNTPKKNNPSNFPGFDKDTVPKTSSFAHLSTT